MQVALTMILKTCVLAKKENLLSYLVEGASTLVHEYLYGKKVASQSHE